MAGWIARHDMRRGIEHRLPGNLRHSEGAYIIPPADYVHALNLYRKGCRGRSGGSEHRQALIVKYVKAHAQQVCIGAYVE